MSDLEAMLAEFVPERVVSVIDGVRVPVDHGSSVLPIINPAAENATGGLIEADRQELAFLECLHSVIPIRSSYDHINRAAKNFQFFAEVASAREPKGVGALIAP